MVRTPPYYMVTEDSMLSLMPTFSVANAVWMELGGVYAVPNLRGGGEYGKQVARCRHQNAKAKRVRRFYSSCRYLINQNTLLPNILLSKEDLTADCS